MFNAIYARKHDAVNGYCVLSAPWPEIEKQYELMLGSSKAAEQFREKHAEISVFRNGEKFASHKFENRKTRLLAEAQKVSQELKAAEITLASAQKRFDSAKAAFEALTPEQLDLLGEPKT
jgi:hypothetical protein